MRVKKNVWGGIFAATVVFIAAMTADILLNQATTISAIYTNSKMGTIFPAEVLAIAVLSIPLIATVSGIMFLRYFLKCRKQQKPQRTATAI